MDGSIASRLPIYLVAIMLVFMSGLANAGCVISSPELGEMGEPYLTTEGAQRLTLECNLAQPAILHFPRNNVNSAELYRVSEPQMLVRQTALVSARQAFLLEPDTRTYYLDIDAEFARPIYPELSSIQEFQYFSTIHTLTISTFLGFCLALIIYVAMLGKSMRNYGFYAYSLYIGSAAVFFMLQEGILFTLFPEANYLNKVKVNLLFAGLTVFTSLRFLDHLLDFKALLKSWQRDFMRSMALIAVLIVSIQLVLPGKFTLQVNSILSTLTMLIMLSLIMSIIYAVIRKVHCARLVLIALSIMMLAMLCRLYLRDFSPFLHRYGLIIGITLEALIFAIAVARKVRKLDDDKMAAFQRAATDPLCLILNRNGWEGAAQTLLNAYNRKGGYLTVMFIDVDNFKYINDTYGHSAGDQVLRVISNILKRQCREQDIVGRLGGDEFVVLSHCHSENQSKRLVERIEQRFAKLIIHTHDQLINVTASVGGYITTKQWDDVNSLLREADKLMYKAKQERHLSFKKALP